MGLRHALHSFEWIRTRNKSLLTAPVISARELVDQVVDRGTRVALLLQAIAVPFHVQPTNRHRRQVCHWIGV